MKKNKYGSVSSDSELDISAALDHSVTEPKKHTPLSAMATDSLQDASAVLSHDLEIAQQMSSEAPLSQSHITIPIFISPLSNSYIQSFEHEGCTYTDDQNKANIFHDFFRDQTLLDDANADIHELPILVSEEYKLSSLNITALEVKSVLENLPLGKAVAPGINNRVFVNGK